MYFPEWPDVRARIEEMMAEARENLLKRGLDAVATEYHRGRHAALADLLKWHAERDSKKEKSS